MKRICTICARGGSKGVKGKNIRSIGGLPLIAHSLRQAIFSGLFDVVAVSSDSDDILSTATKYGATNLVHRPLEMATDTAPKLPVVRHCVSQVESNLGIRFQTCVDLDATSPLRSVQDISEVLQILEGGDCNNVITGMPSRRSPYFNMVEVGDDGVVALSKSANPPIYRRQDAPNCYDMNASIYAWKRDVLMSSSTGLFNSGTRLYVMPEERSIDIDSELDFQFVEFLLNQKILGVK